MGKAWIFVRNSFSQDDLYDSDYVEVSIGNRLVVFVVHRDEHIYTSYVRAYIVDDDENAQYVAWTYLPDRKIRGWRYGDTTYDSSEDIVDALWDLGVAPDNGVLANHYIDGAGWYYHANRCMSPDYPA